MEQFKNIFKNLIRFTYSCFDRIVINGYIVNLLKETDIIYFFKGLKQVKEIDKETLTQRTREYNYWVESYSRKNKVPMEWAIKGNRKEETVQPYLDKIKRQNKDGIYYIMKSMESGTTYRSLKPKYKTKDSSHRFIRKHRSRFTHYYFYIYDKVLGNMYVKVGSYLPFNTVYYINGHEFIEQEFKKNNIKYRKEDNAFLSPTEENTIREASNKFTAEIIRKQLDYWSFVVSPKFSQEERQKMNLRPAYYIAQIEYSTNFIFKRNSRIKELFERICQSGIMNLSYDKISRVFGKRITRHLKGKLLSMLDKFNESMHVFRIYFKNSYLKQYHKCSGLLRNELVCNDLKTLGLKKSLDNLSIIKDHFTKVLDHFADFQSQLCNIDYSSNIFSQLSKPVKSGKIKIPGIKIENDRMIRLMEFLLRYACGFEFFRTKELYPLILKTYGITENDYSFNQLQYDIRKLKAHGIIERLSRSHKYRLTTLGVKACLLFSLFRKNIYGPMDSLQFVYNSKQSACRCDLKFEKIYKKIDNNINELCKRLAA